jgi:hypothetical protein
MLWRENMENLHAGRHRAPDKGEKANRLIRTITALIVALTRMLVVAFRIKDSM